MKKLLLTVAAALLLATNVHAQKQNYGPKAGINFSFLKNLEKIEWQDTPSQDTVFDILRTSFHLGAYYQYQVRPKISIGTELVYVRAGMIYKDHALKLSYTCIPLWGMFHPKGCSKGWGFYMGPTLNFLWKATPVRLYGLIKEDHVTTSEWGVIGGMRYQFAWGLGCDLRYHVGLTDIFYFHHAEERPADIASIALKNHYLQLSVSYNLDTWRRRSRLTH